MTHSYYPENTPPQRRWTTIIQVFREHGWKVDVVAPNPGADMVSPVGRRTRRKSLFGLEVGPSGESIHRTPSFYSGDSRKSRLAVDCMSAAVSVPRALIAQRPDVVVVTIPSLPHIVTGWVVSRLLGRPLVVEMRDAWPDLAYESKFAPRRINRLLDTVMTGVQRRARLVVTVTDGFRQQLEARGIPWAVTVPNGDFTKGLSHLNPRVEHGGPLRVLYMGNHGESQGLDILVRAVAIAGDSVNVRFVGSGTAKPRLQALAKSVGASIEFLEAVVGTNAVAHYEWADTCVVALRPDWSSFDWTIPSKTYELMASRRHITAVLRGEAAAIIQETGAGDVVEAEPLEIARLWLHLLEYPGMLVTPQSGYEWVAEHANMGFLAESYMDVLAQACESDAGLREPQGR